MTSAQKGKIGIVVGGGPAPGINGVISSVTIAAINSGFEVVGFIEGFEHLGKGEPQFIPLTIDAVSRIQNRGGSILRTSRFNPTKDPQHLEAVVRNLILHKVTHLVTIGGDDTAFSSAKVADYAKEKMEVDLHVVHVPKTIDNDLPLPEGIPTFGYETAREIGTQLVKNLMEDSKTAHRWYLVVMMGRTAGHLALGVGKSGGATLTIIPEEFPETVRLSTLCDMIAAAIIKRLSNNRAYGVCVLAEGLVERIAPEDLKELESVERDEHGHIRLAEINFGEIIKKAVQKTLKDLSIKMTLVDKTIGYELRCAPPIAYDVEYTRNLGWAAVDFLKSGGSHAIISVQGDRIVPMFFQDVRDPKTGKTAVRRVNIDSLQYKIGCQYMARLEKSDFADEAALDRMATAANMKPSAFRERFAYLVK